MVMNKSDLVEVISSKLAQPKRKAELAVDHVFQKMSDILEQGGRFEIRGFGSFVVKNYESYTGRNPRTGESIKVEPKRLPAFKVGKELRERVNGGPLMPNQADDDNDD